jgi:hypothetical protein
MGERGPKGGANYYPSERLNEVPEDAVILEGQIEGEPGTEVANRVTEVATFDAPSPEPYVDIPPYASEEPERTTLPTTAYAPTEPKALPPVPQPQLPSNNSPLALPPAGEERPNEHFKIVAIDRSQDARDFARDVADKRLTEKLSADKEKGGIKGFILGVVNNLRRDPLRQREIAKAEQEIRDSNDVLVGLVDDEADRLYAKQSLQQRFMNTEFGDEVIMHAAGEHREIHEQDSPFATSIKGAIESYVNSSDPKAREVFAEEVARLKGAELKKGQDQESRKNPLDITIDNILETGDGIKIAIENGASLENIFNNLEIITGEARTGARTEARYDLGDKVAEKLRALGDFGGLIPEATVLAVAGYVTSACKFFGSGAGTLAGVALPGVMGGVIAGGREWRNLTLERNQNAREVAMGGEIDPTDKRRAKIQEKGGYNLENTDHIISNLQAHLDLISPAEGEPAPDDEALKAAFDALAVAEFRNNMKGKDLLGRAGHVRSDGQVEDFAITRGRLKVALRHGLDPATRARMELSPDMDIDELLADKSKGVEQIALLEKDISDKDKAYLKFKALEATKAGAIGFGVGLAFGLVSQEALAALPFDVPLMNIGTEKTGLVEQLWKDTPDGVHQTVLADWFGPNYGGTQTALAEAVVHLGVDGKPSVEMNGAKFRMETNVDGTLKVIGQDNESIVDNVKLNADGSLPKESIEQLRAQGVDLKPEKPTTGHLVETPPVKKEVSLEDYMKNHKDDTLHIKRNFMDNGSPTTPNGSELGLWSDKVSPDGTYHFNISNMEDSAYDSNGKVVDVKEAVQKGTVRYVVSPDKAFQTEPIVVNVLPDGSMDVPPGHPAAPFLGKGPNGESIVTGAYLEAVNLTGEIDPATGAQKVDVLATVEGNNTAGGRPVMDTIAGEKKQVFDARYKVSVATTGPEMITDIPIYTTAMPLNPMKPIQEREGPQRPETTEPTEPLAPSPAPPEVTPPTPPAPGTDIDRLPPVSPLDRAPIDRGLDVPPQVAPAAVGGRERVVRMGGDLGLESGTYRMNNRRRRSISGGTTRPVTPVGSTRPAALPPGRGPEIYRNRGTTGKESIYGINPEYSQSSATLELTTGSPRGIPKTMTSGDRRTILKEARIFSKAIESMDRKAAVEYLRKIYGNGFQLGKDPDTKKWVVRPSLTGQRYRHADMGAYL